MPREVGVFTAGARELQRIADSRRRGFADADVDGGHGVGRAVSRRERTFITQELDHVVFVVDQCDAVGIAVLQADKRKGQHTVAVFVIGNRAAEAFGVVVCSVVAVVCVERPAAEVQSRGAGDLHEFAGVGTVVVIVKLVDPRIGERLLFLNAEAGKRLVGVDAAVSVGRGGLPRKVADVIAGAADLERVADRRV